MFLKEHEATVLKNYRSIVYDTTVKFKRLYYYDYLSNLYQPGCTKQITLKVSGDTLHTRIFEYDKDGHITKRISKEQEKRFPDIHTYFYNEKGQLAGETQYIGESLFRRREIDYDRSGRVTEEREYGSKPGAEELIEVTMYEYKDYSKPAKKENPFIMSQIQSKKAKTP